MRAVWVDTRRRSAFVSAALRAPHRAAGAWGEPDFGVVVRSRADLAVAILTGPNPLHAAWGLTEIGTSFISGHDAGALTAVPIALSAPTASGCGVLTAALTLGGAPGSPSLIEWRGGADAAIAGGAAARTVQVAMRAAVKAQDRRPGARIPGDLVTLGALSRHLAGRPLTVERAHPIALAVKAGLLPAETSARVDAPGGLDLVALGLYLGSGAPADLDSRRWRP